MKMYLGVNSSKKAAVRVVAVMLFLHLAAVPGMAQAPGGVEDGIRALENIQNSFRAVAKKVLPSVVAIDVVDIVKRSVPRLQSPFDYFFRPREGSRPDRQEEREYRRQGMGSGVIVRRDGSKVYVLSNNHVVGDAEEINITLDDGRRFSAVLVGKDDKKDLALVRFETDESVPVATLGDSDKLQVGDWALAVGNPFGFQSTVTAGIISAIGRRSMGRTGTTGFTDYLQTDAAINQGNSGGALVNIRGQVIGINTWIASPSGGSIGLGFAIPINNAKRAIEDFISRGKVAYGWLGITVGDLQAEVASDMGLKGKQGAFVYGIFHGSPADRGGILPGDYITAIDTTAIADSNQLLRVVGELPPGRLTRFTLLRGGRSRRFSVVIEERADETEIDENRRRIWPGLSVVRITDAIRRQLDLSKSAGQIIVGMVDRGSPSAKIGLRPGDIIKKIGGKALETVADFYSALDVASGSELKFEIFRAGDEVVLTLSKP